jgi:hypothetical protein
MMTTTAPSVKTIPVLEEPAAEIGRLFKLSEKARRLLQDRHQVLACLHLLMENHLYEDAVRLLAHALPKREAVRWACQCTRSVAGANPPPDSEAAVQAAETWAADPNDANRRATYRAANNTGFGTPAGCAALGAFFSDGSLGPANLPAIPPAPLLTAQFVVNAVLLAGVASEPPKALEQYDLFLRQGIRLATGTTQLPAQVAPPRSLAGTPTSSTAPSNGGR